MRQMAGGRRKRTLTPDEVSLWTHVTKHVAPIEKQKAKAEPVAEVIAPIPELKTVSPPAKMVRATKSVAPAPPLPPKAAPAIPPLAPLEKRLRQRLSRGAQPIDSVIDLHGKRQDEAHEALRRFVLGAHQMGYSVILVVTGKGASGTDDHGIFEERGVLRRTVPHWLRMPDMRPFVIGFEPAAPHHGGSGALYVRIRRKRGSIGE
jgi:DNA-nicking Smr family endonuclease